jgi:sulfite exporter TauE/SafE
MNAEEKNFTATNCQCCEEPGKKSEKSAIVFTILAALLLVVYFILLKNGAFSLLARLNDQGIGLGLIFVIGLLASFHCVGMCGSFVAAYSAKQLEKGQKVGKASHFQYNIGRLLSYSLSGFLLGAFGSVFQINSRVSGALVLLAGTVMVVMGIKLVSGGKFLSGIKLKLPNSLLQFIAKQNKKAPFLIGLLTALMPCGPLQAMQLYALSTGSAIKGALAMAAYAAGTFPIMMLFGSFLGALSSAKIKNLLKISGVIVIVLGLLTLSRGWSDSGLQRQAAKPINKISGKKDISADQYYANSVPTDKYQTVEMEITSSGFKPNVIKIKKGLPVRWIVKDGGVTGCTNEIILYNGEQEIRQKISSPQSIIKFMPAEQTEIKFSCWMKMVWGKFIVE